MIEFDLDVKEVDKILEFERNYIFSLKKGSIEIKVITRLQKDKKYCITTPEEIDIQIEKEFKRIKKTMNDELIRKMSGKIINDLTENEIKLNDGEN